MREAAAGVRPGDGVGGGQRGALTLLPGPGPLGGQLGRARMPPSGCPAPLSVPTETLHVLPFHVALQNLSDKSYREPPSRRVTCLQCEGPQACLCISMENAPGHQQGAQRYAQRRGPAAAGAPLSP